MTTSSNPPPVNKLLVGIIGVVCLIASAVFYFYFPDQTSARSACLRIGVVMVALFFALPKPGEHVRWERLVPIFLGSVVLIVLSKRMILVALPLIIVVGILLAFLRPRSKPRPPRAK
jgi:hypothetical protein